MLTFKEHVAYVNKKAGRSITALERVSRCLEYDIKICVLQAFLQLLPLWSGILLEWKTPRRSRKYSIWRLNLYSMILPLHTVY